MSLTIAGDSDSSYAFLLLPVDFMVVRAAPILRLVDLDLTVLDALSYASISSAFFMKSFPSIAS